MIINGKEVELYESMYEYVASATFAHYEPEYRSYTEDAIVVEVYPAQDSDFVCGETIEVDGKEYTHVNFGEDGISYIRTQSLDQSVWCMCTLVGWDSYHHEYKYVYTDGVYETKLDAIYESRGGRDALISLDNGMTLITAAEALARIAEKQECSIEDALQWLTHFLDFDTCEKTNDAIHDDVGDIEWLELYLINSEHDIIIG